MKIYVVTGTENAKNFVEEFTDKVKLEMWITYRKSISSSFEYAITEREPKSIFDVCATYEGRWFPTGVVMDEYTQYAEGIKCGLSRNTWIPDPNPNPMETIWRKG